MTASPPALPPARDAKPTWLHPASAVVILLLDWLAWQIEALTALAGTPVTVFLVFFATLILVFRIQTRIAQDTKRRAARKALVGAIAAAVPFPITGTLLGGWILARAGLRALPVSRGAAVRWLGRQLWNRRPMKKKR